MRLRILPVACLTLTVGILFVTGCGGGATAPAKSASDLTEQDKQQIREYQEQGAQEWGGTPKKK